MKKTLLVIDMQEDFINGSLRCIGSEAIVSRIDKLINHCLNKGYELIFTRDTHDENYLETLEGKSLPIHHCQKNTPGWEILPPLAKYLTKGTVVNKNNFGAKDLINLVEDSQEIIIVGICTDICVITNALMLRAIYPEKKIIVMADGCWGLTKEAHEAALTQMKTCLIEIKNIEEDIL